MRVMKNKHAVSLGRIGGSKKSERKTESCRTNGSAGGRPAKDGRYRAYEPSTHRQGPRRLSIEASTADAYRMKNGIVIQKSEEGYCKKLDGDFIRIGHERIAWE